MRLQSLVEFAALPFPRSRRLGRQQLVIPRLWGLSAPLRTRPFHGHGAKGVLVIAPAEQGSLGDEAILQGSIASLRANGLDGPIGLVAFGQPGQWRNLKGVDEHVNLQHLLNVSATREWIALTTFVQRFRHVLLLGTDCMDGHYSVQHTLQRLNMAQLAAKLGRQVAILAISINRRPKEVCTEAIRKLSPKVAITCRDRISAARLTQHSGRQVATTADLAFLLEPDETSPAASQAIRWIEHRRATGQVVYGINVNEHLTMEGSLADRQTLLARVAETLNHLHRRRRACFVFIPHDRRAPRIDAVTGANLAKLLDETVRDDFMMLEEPISAAEVKGVVGHCDMALTGRMHVAIAALGRGVPVACITYQGKFEGLLEHFGIALACISPEAAMHKSAFFNFVETQIARREVDRRSIAARLPAVVKLAAANLGGIR